MSTIAGTLKCCKCGTVLEVRLTAASPMQSQKGLKTSNAASDVGELLESVDRDSLTEWETEFIDKTQDRYDEYGDRIQMSDKQMEILRRIAEK